MMAHPHQASTSLQFVSWASLHVKQQASTWMPWHQQAQPSARLLMAGKAWCRLRELDKKLATASAACRCAQSQLWTRRSTRSKL